MSSHVEVEGKTLYDPSNFLWSWVEFKELIWGAARCGPLKEATLLDSGHSEAFSSAPENQAYLG